jgi:nucleoside phosphorylase
MNPSILVCAATQIEARACLSGIKRAGVLGHFEILQTGMGPNQARQTLKSRLNDINLPKPTLIISTGFAGCLGASPAVGSWVVGKVIESEEKERWNLNDTHLFLSESIQTSLQLQDGHFFSISKLQPNYTQLLSLSSGNSETANSRKANNLPILVDMESFSWADIARSSGIPFIILRMISDNEEHPLPESVFCFASTRLFQGLAKSFTQPVVLGKFIWRSLSLPKELSQGWTNFSIELASKQA